MPTDRIKKGDGISNYCDLPYFLESNISLKQLNLIEMKTFTTKKDFKRLLEHLKCEHQKGKLNDYNRGVFALAENVEHLILRKKLKSKETIDFNKIQEYTTFCIKCDKIGLLIIPFKDYIRLDFND